MKTITIKNDAIKYTLTKRDYNDAKDWDSLSKYICDNVQISEETKADLLDKMFVQGIPLEYANKTLADKIGNAVEDWCFDNDVDCDSIFYTMGLTDIYEEITKV